MNIGDFVKVNQASQYLSNSAGVPALTKVGTAATSGLGKADKRLQIELDSTTAQLSSMGQLKSAVAQVQTASRNLGSLASTATATDEKTALSHFVSSFNTAVAAAKATAQAPGDVLTTHSASRAGQDLKSAVSANDPTLAALKKVGITQGTDGTLTLDSQKFEAAQKSNTAGVRTALVQVGKALNSAASQELATDGNVGLSLSYLSQKAGTLKTQQSALASLSQGTHSNPSATSFSFGLNAYRNS